MTDRSRALLQDLTGELVAVVQESASRSASERAAGAQRWSELQQRAEGLADDGTFQHALTEILEPMVTRLQAVVDKRA